jgi:hypothetical protein
LGAIANNLRAKAAASRRRPRAKKSWRAGYAASIIIITAASTIAMTASRGTTNLPELISN